MSKLAQDFMDDHWPDEWPERGDAYDLILAEWEQEYKAAILDRWIEFRDAHQIKQHSPNNPCRCTGPSWKPHDPDCALWKAEAPVRTGNNKEDKDWCAECGTNFRGHPKATATQHMFITAAGLRARKEAEAPA